MSDEQARLDRCPTCGSYGHVVTSDEGTSYFAPQQARVDLAERLEKWALSYERPPQSQWDRALAIDLREAASALRNQAKALEAADELAERILARQAHLLPSDVRHDSAKKDYALALAYHSTRTTTEEEAQ